MKTLSLFTPDAAPRLLDYQGKRVHAYPVTVQLNDSRLMDTVAIHRYQVTSTSAAAAANLIRAIYADRPETEITVFGPYGGRAAYRYVGWHTAIGHALFQGWPAFTQPRFDFMAHADCECIDAGCPVHAGRHCDQPSDTRVFRSDMHDVSGLSFCESCANDALASGVFHLR